MNIEIPRSPLFYGIREVSGLIPAYLHQDREKPWNFRFQGFSHGLLFVIVFGFVAQLGERCVRIHSETHPTRFSVPRFPVRFVGLPPENRIFQKSKIRNFFRTKSADLGS